MRVIIIGAGVIGSCLAYFLARRGARPVVIERNGVGSAASGKSGGFLALDWCDGTPLEALARRSFALHAELAASLGGDAWFYRRFATFGGHFAAGGASRAAPSRPWLAAGVRIGGRLGSKATTAQVHPALFTRAMMQAAGGEGAELLAGAVVGLLTRRGRIEGVCLEEGEVRGDAVVVAMGPWSVFATEWLELPRIFALKGHSLLFETGANVPSEALFLEYAEERGEVLTPEVFPRADGTTYVCAISSQSHVPPDPADVAADPGAYERLEALCRHLSPTLAASRIIARQACFRPVTVDGLPLIGKVPGLEGAYVATGHSVWGILNAPATGEALAEMILEGGSAPRLDLSPFDPGRLPPAR